VGSDCGRSCYQPRQYPTGITTTGGIAVPERVASADRITSANRIATTGQIASADRIASADHIAATSRVTAAGLTTTLGAASAAVTHPLDSRLLPGLSWCIRPTADWDELPNPTVFSHLPAHPHWVTTTARSQR
jgi:hypothetical protein